MWSRRDLNPRPLRCERSALPAELLPHCRIILRLKSVLGHRLTNGRVAEAILQHRFQPGAQAISQFGAFQGKANLCRQKAQAIAQIISDPFEFVAVKLASLA